MSLTPEQIVEVLRLTKSPNNGALMWAVDKDGSLWVGVNCSDTFAWGCSDAEEITADNLPELQRAYADCAGIQNGDIWAPDLFAARVRRRKPYAYTMTKLLGNPQLHALFDAIVEGEP